MLLIKKSWNLSKEFFLNKETRFKAISLLLASMILELLMVYVAVIMNKWSNDFYNALQALDKLALYKALKVFFLVVLFAISVFVSKYVLQSRLALSWRKFMTETYLGKWGHNKAYYSSNLIDHNNDNPDQRISEDLNSFTSLTISLSFGILNSVVTLISFVTILWSLSGTLVFPWFGQDIVIHGYLVWTALLYSIIITIVTYKIGKRLSGVDYLQEKKEANFRFSMMRLRENAEAVALYRGEKYENKIFKNAFEQIVENTLAIISINKNLKIWTNLFINVSNIFPILIACPRLFAKEIQLGGLMQIRSAFVEVQESLSFLALSFQTIASYRAVIERLTEFNANINEWNSAINSNKISIYEAEQPNLVLNNLVIRLPNQEIMLNLNYNFLPGSSYLITGRNGAGKSSLIKALGGLWIFGEGEIIFPQGKSRFFIPQRTYMPSGNLIQAIYYPSCEVNDIEDVVSLMKEIKLSHLIDRLYNNENWSTSLSLGEQQKIAILRAIIHNPDILIMDESVSAVAEEEQKTIYKLIKDRLAKAIIISIGHTANLRSFHDNEIKIA
jgi:putative ATP-binding cassette transporter